MTIRVSIEPDSMANKGGRFIVAVRNDAGQALSIPLRDVDKETAIMVQRAVSFAVEAAITHAERVAVDAVRAVTVVEVSE